MEHRSVFQDAQTEFASRRFSGLQRQCGAVANLDCTFNRITAALCGVALPVVERIRAIVYRGPFGPLAPMATAGFAGLLWDSRPANSNASPTTTGLFCWVLEFCGTARSTQTWLKSNPVKNFRERASAKTTRQAQKSCPL